MEKNFLHAGQVGKQVDQDEQSLRVGTVRSLCRDDPSGASVPRSGSRSIKAIGPYSVGVIAIPYSLSRAGCRWPTMEPSVKPFSVSLIRREPRSSEARWRKADWNGEAENGREATLRRQGVPCPAATSSLLLRTQKERASRLRCSFWLNRQLPILPERFHSSTFGV